MRQLEADSAKEHPNAKGLLRPKAAYEAAMMLVDASQHAWKVLYLDSQASTVTGELLTSPQQLGRIQIRHGCHILIRRDDSGTSSLPSCQSSHSASGYLVACTVHRPRAPMQLERCFSTIIRMLTLLVLETCHCRYVCKPPWQQPSARCLNSGTRKPGCAGISVSMAGASTFWGLFSSPDAPGDHPWKGYTDQTENSLDFMLRNIQRRGSSNHTVFSLAFT